MSLLTLFSTEFTKALAKYSLISSLVDSVGNQSGTLTRSTTKTFIHDDLTVDTAAIDTAAFTGSGVLLEPEATNLLTYSQDLSDASWTKNNATIGANTADTTAPDGTNTADKITATTSTFCAVQKAITISSGQTRYMCVIYKADTAAHIVLMATNSGATATATQYFNASTGAVGTASATGSGWSIGAAGSIILADGWIFFWAKVLTTGTYFAHRFYLANANGSTAITSGKTGYLWQSDNKENLSSPILTTSTALTRTGEVLTVPTTTWKNNDFAIYFKIDAATLDQLTSTELMSNFVSADDKITLTYVTSGPQFTLSFVSGGVEVTASALATPILTTPMDMMITYKDGAVLLNVNGTTATSSGAIGALTLAATTQFGGDGTGFTFNGVMSYLKFINTSNITLAQAAAL